MKKSLGLYVHIPFCVRKCFYCDFCSFPDSDGERIRAYTDELCRRIADRAGECGEYNVDTVYFGGGTPTLLPVGLIERLMQTIKDNYDISDDPEISAECNPATADKEYLKKIRDMGINRLSMGLQSIHKNELDALGRIHSFSDLVDTFSAARLAGFSNISIDLMYGIPEQTVESFRDSLRTVAKLGAEHISAYGLKIERGTPFYKMRDSLVLPDEDSEYEMYLSMSDILAEYGYEKYEISNFSRKGFESRHNLRYWMGGEYLGFGVAAHSYFGGERFGNSRDIAAFIDGKNIECERYAINETESDNEYIMLSLRLSAGIDLEDLERRMGKSFFEYYPKARELVKQEYMRLKDGRIAFTDKGFFVSNAILSDMLEFDR